MAAGGQLLFLYAMESTIHSFVGFCDNNYLSGWYLAAENSERQIEAQTDDYGGLLCYLSGVTWNI